LEAITGKYYVGSLQKAVTLGTSYIYHGKYWSVKFEAGITVGSREEVTWREGL